MMREVVDDISIGTRVRLVREPGYLWLRGNTATVVGIFRQNGGRLFAYVRLQDPGLIHDRFHLGYGRSRRFVTVPLDNVRQIMRE